MTSAAPGAGEPQVLFGDLHTHTSYSLDAYLFGTQLVKGTGVTTPADACDFARYCSGLDFWSINDHAEGLTPRVWADTLQVIRECNANAGDPTAPDMVSFVGWEWSNSERDDIPSHYGHKNVIFRTWEEGMAPARPTPREGMAPVRLTPREGVFLPPRTPKDATIPPGLTPKPSAPLPQPNGRDIRSPLATGTTLQLPCNVHCVPGAAPLIHL